MPSLPIITAPDQRLKVPSKPVGTVDAEVRKLLDDMLATMYEAPGIGLSAIQVGIARQLIAIDVSAEDRPNEPLFLINPKIVRFSDALSTYDEGCLSLPNHFAEVDRPEEITVDYVDYHGKKQSLKAGGLLARCIQHEMDHLDGVLFVDHISLVRRNMILRKLQKARRQKVVA